MKQSINKNLFAIVAISIILISVVIGIFSQQYSNSDESVIRSQYAGQEVRGIKALSQDDIEGLLSGAGTPFGGMAKPAELNGYPGPRHVLDAIEAGEFELTNEQQDQVEALYEEMRKQAIELGEQIVDIEKTIDDAFSNKTMTESFLQNKISSSADLYSQLRFIHLKYHLSMQTILTSQQVEQYNELRGYTSGDPCENIPEGHEAEQWKLHNDCE